MKVRTRWAISNLPKLKKRPNCLVYTDGRTDAKYRKIKSYKAKELSF